MLSFPPTPPHCASLLLPLLSCYKSSTFPLSMTLPIPPLSGSLPLLFPPALTFHILLPSPCVCQNEWQVSLPDAKLLLGGSFDDDLTSSMCACSFSFLLLLLSLCVVRTLLLVWRNENEREEEDRSCNWTLAVLDEAFSKYLTREAKMRI